MTPFGESTAQATQVRDVAGRREFVLRATVVGLGYHVELPFDVPPGCNRVQVRLEADAAIGLGLFDERGPRYQSPGFRGVYGGERRECAVAADAASDSFLPGPVNPGRWTVLVPVLRALLPTEVVVTVTLGFGPQPPAAAPGPPQGTVRDEAGWYAGDLHAHTPHSSDAWAGGGALHPSGWARTAAREGLHFVALTDHNVVTQNRDLAAAAEGTGVLLLAGEEMTNWFHGHATVAGLQPGDWLDFRQRPAPLSLGPHEARITEFLATAREMGAYVAAAHPLAGPHSWQFLPEAVADPAARPDGLEVWNGYFGDDDGVAVGLWDRLLRTGLRMTASGGTDLHDLRGGPAVFGTPTTWVSAERLSSAALVDALRRGRATLTRTPGGARCEVRAGGPDGDAVGMGGVAHGAPGKGVHALVRVLRGEGQVMRVIAAGRVLHEHVLTEPHEMVRVEVPVGSGYVRAEVRGLDDDRLEALTNPVYLQVGEPDGETDSGAAPVGV